MASTIFLPEVGYDDVRASRFPKRSDLMRVTEPSGLSALHLQVHRNYAFELIASVLPPFLWIAGFRPVITCGAYDDTLAFHHIDPGAVQVVTLDFERYRDHAHAAEFSDWFARRIKNLREKTEAPIVISDWPSEEDYARKFNLAVKVIADRFPSVFVWNTAETFRTMGEDFFDDRAVQAKGTRLSDRACIELARSLGLVRLTSSLRPRIKAVVVDLDDTLYEGILGEDGTEGIRITSHHTAIYKELLRLREEGVFLGVLSKNDERDFADLCASRADFLLRPEHFSARSIGWQTKPDGLAHIAEHLRIGIDSMLVVDDNPGEMEQIRAVHGNAHLLHSRSAEQTLFWLRHYPALNGYRSNATALLRLSDLEASNQRERLRESTSGADYLREMQIELTYALNPVDNCARLSELSQKTNQFNTGLQRFSEIQVARRMQAGDHCVISVSMRDRFCDSGVIGAIFAYVAGDCIVVDEVCISCRVLGRNVESPMIARALGPIIDQRGSRDIAFRFLEGPRNLPACMWLKEFTGVTNIEPESIVPVAWKSIPQLSKHMTAPITCRWERTV